MDSRRARKFALGIFLIALLVRVGWALYAHVTPISDFAGYDDIARYWRENGLFPGAHRTPGYPVFLASIYTLFGHELRAVALIQALLGALNAGLIVLLAARFVSARTALLAGLLYALSPTAVVYIPVLANETLTLTLLFSGMLLLLAGGWLTTPRAGVLVLSAGICFGLMVMVRSAAIFFLPGLFVLGFYLPDRRRWSLKCGLVLLLGMVLVIGPWVARNVRVGLGPRLSTTGGVTLWEGNNDRATLRGYTTPSLPLHLSEREKDAYYDKLAMTWIISHPTRYAVLSAARFGHITGIEPDSWAARWLVPSKANDELMTRDWLYHNRHVAAPSTELQAKAKATSIAHRRVLRYLRVLLCPFLFLGLFLWTKQLRRWAFIMLPLWSYLLGMALSTGHARYREMSDPLLCIAAAAVMIGMLEWWGFLSPAPQEESLAPATTPEAPVPASPA